MTRITIFHPSSTAINDRAISVISVIISTAVIPQQSLKNPTRFIPFHCSTSSFSSPQNTIESVIGDKVVRSWCRTTRQHYRSRVEVAKWNWILFWFVIVGYGRLLLLENPITIFWYLIIFTHWFFSCSTRGENFEFLLYRKSEVSFLSWAGCVTLLKGNFLARKKVFKIYKMIRVSNTYRERKLLSVSQFYC